VARFEPFRGIRYDPARAELGVVTAPPYDVLSEADRDQFAERDPHNIVRIDVPLERHGPGRYQAAAVTLQRWLEEGVLLTDEAPSFYIERMTFTDEGDVEHTTTGVLGALEVVDPGRGQVLPHEETTPKARSDRLDLTRATTANLSAIWGLSLAGGLSEVLSEPAEWIGAFTDEAGVHHTFERLTEPTRLAAIELAVGAAPVIIADGHHRYEVARAYREERLATTGGQAGPWDLTLAFIVELAEDQLAVQAIHRLLTQVPADFDLEAALGRSFEVGNPEPVTPLITQRLLDADALCLIEPDGLGRLLRPRPGVFGSVEFDSQRVERALADVPGTVVFQHGVDRVLSAVADGRANYGVLLRPVAVHQIAATAHDNRLMPAKSTFFAPKPKTGLVIRSLRADDEELVSRR
jgi:uncharacterized protein (DUF1015 family)